MEIAQAVLISAGLVLALLAILLSRADRLSSGYGAVWLLFGLLLVASGLVGPPVAELVWNETSAAPRWLLLATLLAWPALLAILLFQAASLSRLKEQLLSLAQEVALLRSALEKRAVDRKDTGTDPGPRSS